MRYIYVIKSIHVNALICNGHLKQANTKKSIIITIENSPVIKTVENASHP